MAFKPSKELTDIYKFTAILSNSITVSVGDSVIINSGAPEFVTGGGGTTGILLGTVQSIINGPASGNTPLQVDTYTTSGTNQTVEQVSVKILPTQNLTTYVADLDAPAGTTPNSGFLGYFNLSASNGVLDESSYLAGTEEQFLSYGVNPGNPSQVIGVFTKIAQA